MVTDAITDERGNTSSTEKPPKPYEAPLLKPVLGMSDAEYAIARRALTGREPLTYLGRTK